MAEAAPDPSNLGAPFNASSVCCLCRPIQYQSLPASSLTCASPPGRGYKSSPTVFPHRPFPDAGGKPAPAEEDCSPPVLAGGATVRRPGPASGPSGSGTMHLPVTARDAIFHETRGKTRTPRRGLSSQPCGHSEAVAPKTRVAGQPHGAPKGWLPSFRCTEPWHLLPSRPREAAGSGLLQAPRLLQGTAG